MTRLQIRLAAGDVKADSHDLRVLGAQAALRRAAEVLGHSPSVEEYRSVRSEHKDAGFPSDGTIRRILGGTWNDALVSAHLQTVEGGDMIIASLGVAFTRDELIAGLRECAQELGMAPSVPQYLGWARRPDVRRRADGRRARAIEAYNRVFGSWTKGLVAAGLIDGSDPEVLTRVADGRTRIYKITDAGIATAIREIADHLGHVPSTIEYQSAREERLNAAIKEGTPRGFPSYQVVYRRYGNWAAALEAAGLTPRTGRGQGKRPESRPYGPRTSDETCLDALRRAYEECGGPLTRDVYERWRKEKRAASGGVLYLPGYTRFLSGWGSWWAALDAAFGGDDRTHPPADAPQFRKHAKPRGRYRPPTKPDAQGSTEDDATAEPDSDSASLDRNVGDDEAAMPKPEVDVVEALLSGLDHASLTELERVLLGRLSAPEPLSSERARLLGELARLLPPPILGSLPRVDRALYDRERAVEAPSSHSLVGTFGSWGLACLKAASMAPNGAITGPSHPWASPLRGRAKPPPYTDQEIDDAIRACAHELRHTPTTASYHAWALRRRREEQTNGVWPVRIPTFGTINRRPGGWR